MKTNLLVIMSLLASASVSSSFAQDATVIVDLENDPEPAQLVSPSTTVPLSSSTVQFQWSPGSQVGEYWLWIGTAANTPNVLNQSMGLQTSYTANQLPINGQPLFVTLFSWVGGQWHWYSYQYA